MQELNIDISLPQQDGATCLTVTKTINLLKGQFGDNFISRNGPVNWPPKSCDLTLPDYFLWGYVRSRVYVNKTTTLEGLEVNINPVINEIRPEIFEKLIKNWIDRMHFLMICHGGHMPEIIFKILMTLNLPLKFFIKNIPSM